MNYPVNIAVAHNDFKIEFKGSPNSSDIRWNAFSGEISVTKDSDQIKFKVFPFTKNCGIKTFEQVSLPERRADPTTLEEFMQCITDIYRSVFNTGIIIASTPVNGYQRFREFLDITEFQKSELAWNPNYTWDRAHKIYVAMLFIDQVPNSENLWNNVKSEWFRSRKNDKIKF